MTISYSSRGTPTMEQIKNVSATTAANGEVLIYNSTTELWENGTAGTPAGTEIVGTDNLRSLTFGTGTPSGTNNILLGASAGEDLTTGTMNTLIGFNTGKEITTGINNVFIAGWLFWLSASTTLPNSKGGASAMSFKPMVVKTVDAIKLKCCLQATLMRVCIFGSSVTCCWQASYIALGSGVAKQNMLGNY